MLWAGQDMWKHFGVDIMPATNSSFQYLKKSKEVDDLFEIAKDFLDNHTYDYRNAPEKWGKGEDPDELYLNAAIAKLKIDPSFKTPIHYPIKNSQKIIDLWNIENITNREDLKHYYALSYAGDGRNINRFGKNIYNSTMTRVLRKQGLNHVRKIELLLKRKFIR